MGLKESEFVDFTLKLPCIIRDFIFFSLKLICCNSLFNSTLISCFIYNKEPTFFFGNFL